MTDLLQRFAKGTVPAGLAFRNKKDVLFLLVTCLTIWVMVWGSNRYLSCGSLSGLEVWGGYTHGVTTPDNIFTAPRL